MNKFILDTFHGREAQEATVEYLSSLSLYNSANEKGSIVQGLKNARDEIMKHINLVPKNLQTGEEQKRWLKYAVRSYRWARPTTARASELDFATMYATLRAQAIEEKRAADMKGRTTRGRIGEKTLGNVLFGDTYGNPPPSPKYRPFVYKNSRAKQFNRKCFACGKYGYRRVDCPFCKEKHSYATDGQKALQAINSVTSMAAATEVIQDLKIQYGEHWTQVLDGSQEGKEEELSSSQEGEGIAFAAGGRRRREHRRQPDRRASL